MAAELSGIEATETARIRALIEAAGLPVSPPAIGSTPMLDAMSMDKKVLKKQLRFVLLDELGHARVSGEYDERALTAVLEVANG